MSGGSYASSACPCADPTPVCMNTSGGYTCGSGTAFGDPHLRVSTPGEDAVCFDVNANNGAILDLFSDNESSLQVNAQFKVNYVFLSICSYVFDLECSWRQEAVYQGNWFYFTTWSSSLSFSILCRGL